MMKMRYIMFLLAILGLIILNGSEAMVMDAEAKKLQYLEIDKKLKLLNKPAVKSIKNENGDIVDCVDINKQPAFDHPALQNHKIQMTPSFEFPSEAPSPSPSPIPGPIRSHVQNDHYSSQIVSQYWQKNESCPDGTIPIRRIRRRDLLRAASLERFGMKNPAPNDQINREAPEPYLGDDGSVNISNRRVNLGPQANRSCAVLVTTAYSYIGAQGDINVWNPKVAARDEYTTAQIWMKNGPGNAFESVEAGWMVNPRLYGDTATRFFIYWTNDAYKSTGCHDLICSGFVQTNKNVTLGMPLNPISTEGEQQYQITISINKDPQTNNWWLRIGENTVVGYWPPSLFYYMELGPATLVEWGGEVYSSMVKKRYPHTETAMGSGNFASGLQGYACYINHPRIVDYSMQLKYPEWVGTYVDEGDCYSAQNYARSLAYEPSFYFGGPGRSYHYCP